MLFELPGTMAMNILIVEALHVKKTLTSNTISYLANPHPNVTLGGD
jgi:hypothetical protein